MESKLAREGAQARIEAARRMTPEQRVAAFFEHSRLITQLYLAGKRQREALQRPANRGAP